MKKIFCRLAALMLIAALVMTSCNSVLDEVAPEEETLENVVTLTIKMPEQAETRVGVDGTTLKLTGWEENDIVKVYKVKASGNPNLDVPEGIPFTCTDPSNGIFTSTSLPEGKTLNDYNVAVYGHDIEGTGCDYAGFLSNQVSTTLKDGLFLAGPISDGCCTMTIQNNVIKVNNQGSSVTGAWKRSESATNYVFTYCLLDGNNNFQPAKNYSNEVSSTFTYANPITIPSGISYIFIPFWQGTLGLFTEDNRPIIPVKDFGTEGSGVGTLFTYTILAP